MQPAANTPASSGPTPPPAPPAPPSEMADAATTARTAPRTARDLVGLRVQRDELGGQLVATHQRRTQLAGELMTIDPAARAGLLQQIGVLDRRIVQLETDMSATVHLMAIAPPGLLVENETPPPRAVSSIIPPPPRHFVLLGRNGPSPNAVPALLLLVLLLQLLAFARARTRRIAPAAQDGLLRDAAARLARVEQAVDAIAVEVERVSEGQRFVTRAVAERAGSHVGVE